MRLITEFAREDFGTTAVDCGLIAVVIIGATRALGTKLSVMFNHVAANLS